MRPLLLALTVCAAAALAPAASGMTCYLVLDRNDNVIYQDIFPPLDLSDAGDAERKAMRARNEHMIAMETDRCPRLELVAGQGAGRINLEQMSEPMTLKPSSDADNAPAITRSGGAPAPAKAKPAAKAPAKPAAPAS
jgi:hypothetical protein